MLNWRQRKIRNRLLPWPMCRRTKAVQRQLLRHKHQRPRLLRLPQCLCRVRRCQHRLQRGFLMRLQLAHLEKWR